MQKESTKINALEKTVLSKEKKLKQSITKRHKFLISIIIGLILLISFKSSERSFYKTDKIRINYVRRRYGAFLKNLPTYEHSYVTNKTLYWCWLQGLKDISKLGLQSEIYKKNLQDYNIIIINEININEYVNIPKYIMDKFKKGIFTRIHFSDILRLELLNTYGGTWIDASVLITKYEPRFYDKTIKNITPFKL